MIDASHPLSKLYKHSHNDNRTGQLSKFRSHSSKRIVQYFNALDEDLLYILANKVRDSNFVLIRDSQRKLETIQNGQHKRATRALLKFGKRICRAFVIHLIVKLKIPNY